MKSYRFALIGRVFSYAIVAGSFAGLVGCSVMKNMTEMHDTTQEMAKTTNDMKTTTGKMKETTDRLYEAARQGTSLLVRLELLKDMQAAKSQVEKLDLAAVYFMSFEIQIWSGVGPDTLKSREEIAAEAAEEFIRTVQRFMVDRGEFIPVASPEVIEKAKADPAMNDPKLIARLDQNSNLNALAVAMHKSNRIQNVLDEENQAAVKANGAVKRIEPITMYSMIKEAIKADKQIEAGKAKPGDFPAYVAKIRSFMDEAKILMQVRQTTLSMMAVARVSKLMQDESPLMKMQAMATAPWTFENVNSQVMRDAALYLDGAVKARKFLKENGIEPMDTSPFTCPAKAIFAQGQPSNEMKAASESRADNEPVAATIEFLQAVENYKAN